MRIVSFDGDTSSSIDADHVFPTGTEVIDNTLGKQVLSIVKNDGSLYRVKANDDLVALKQQFKNGTNTTLTSKYYIIYFVGCLAVLIVVLYKRRYTGLSRTPVNNPPQEML